MRFSILALVVVLGACSAPSEPSPDSTAGTTDMSPSVVALPVPSTDTFPTVDQEVPDNQSSGLVCWSAPVEPGSGEIAFEDVTEAYGLVEPLTGMYGHAAAFGDLNGDAHPDLVVGTFADRPTEEYAIRGADGPTPDRVLLGGESYRPLEFDTPAGRTSGSVLADLDGDGDSDLVLVRNGEEPPASVIFANRDGKLEAVAEPLPVPFNGRTPAVADFDGDGLLDVYVSEDRYGGMGGVLLRNEDSFRFTDVTEGSGLGGVFALGATAADLDRDGIPDLVTSDRIFFGNGNATFEEWTPEALGWEQVGPDDDPAGVATGDYDNDGLLDIVIGQHYRSIVEEGAEVPVRLFRNLGDRVFEEVTQTVGLLPLPTLAPHVEFADIDNDGWLDIVASGSVGERAAPIVLVNREGAFELPEGLGTPHYWVGAPVADVDLDGRLDVFGLEWEPSLPSRLFRNVTPGGHWLQVSVADPVGGVGSAVEVFANDGALLGSREIGAASGYSSGKPAVAHFGLGDVDVVSVVITTRAGETVTIEDVQVDVHLRWPDGC